MDEEQGKLLIQSPIDRHISPDVMVEPNMTEEELEAECQWEASFAKSRGALAKLAAKARADFAAGRTEELDPERL